MDAVVFLLGIHVGMMLIAALYSLIDLAYAWRTYLPVIVRRIAAAAGLFLALCWLLGEQRTALLWGGISYVAFHVLQVLALWLLVPWVYRYRRRQRP